MTDFDTKPLFDAGFKITNIKFFRGREGSGVNANLKFRGKLVAEMDDDGWGGGLNVRWEPTTLAQEAQKIVAEIVKSVPPVNTEWGGGPLTVSEDWFLDECITNTKFEQEMRRKCKKGTVFVEPGEDPRMGYHEYKGHPYEGQMVEYMAKNHPNARILNLEFAE